MFKRELGQVRLAAWNATGAAVLRDFIDRRIEGDADIKKQEKVHAEAGLRC